MSESPGGMTPTHSNPEGTLPEQPQINKLRGRKRLLQSLQRISSSPSLARIGRIPSSSSYRTSGKGSMSCVSLSLSHSSSPAPSTPYHHSSQNSQSSTSSAAYSTPPTSTYPTPASEIPFNDQIKPSFGVRVIDAGIFSGGLNSATSVPLPADLRPSSKGIPLGKTPEVCEAFENAEDYFSTRSALPQPIFEVEPKPLIDHWGRMPAEINMEILRYLKPKEIIRCSAVSRSWQKLCFDGQLWTSFDAAEFYRQIPAETLTKIISSAGPFVRDLNLRGCVQLQVGARAEELADACRNIRTITLEGSHADRNSINYLLQRNNQLVHVNLSGLKGVTNGTCRIIGQHCPQLESVNVNWCLNMDARGVLKIVNGCAKVKDLRINECRGLVDKQIMVRLFETNRLERLIMHGCSDVRDEHLKVLFEGIDPEVCPITRRAMVPPRRLRHLDISKLYYLTDKGLQALAGNVPDLEGLQLGGDVELTDDALTDLLPTVPRLTHLDLEELSELTNETAKNIAISPCRDRLQHVSFSYCESVGDTGMLPLIRACRNLKNLEMDNTRVSDLSLAEAADVVRSRSGRSVSQCEPEIGLRIVIYDCQHITWTGIREVISRNAEVKRPGAEAGRSYPTEVIQLKCFYGWQMTVDEHMKRVLKGDLSAASRLERKWGEYMMATEEAGAPGAGSRRRRRRAREAAMLHADEEEAGAGPLAIGRRRRARSGGCAVM